MVKSVHRQVELKALLHLPSRHLTAYEDFLHDLIRRLKKDNKDNDVSALVRSLISRSLLIDNVFL